MPSGYDALEAEARSRIAARFKRGNLTVQLTVNRPSGEATLQVNQAMLRRVLDLAIELSVQGVAPPRLDGILNVRGVLEAAEADTGAADPERLAALAGDLDQAIGVLAAARGEEGARLGPVVLDQLGQIEALTARARELAATQPQALKARLVEAVRQLAEQSPPVAEERLVQEIVLMAAKADVREELDRLTAHIDQARELMAGGGPVGRRLDFLCQEFNREANTLCSKSADTELTRTGLELKAVIEQMREQIQNLE